MALPIGDVLVVALAPLAVVGAIGEKIVVAVLAREFIAVGALPGIKQHLLAFQIGPVPACEIGGLHDKRIKPLLLARIAAHIQFEEIEGRAKALNLGASSVLLGLVEIF